MEDTIPPGAYIIRNQGTSAVLQINSQNQYGVAPITANIQDEEKYREQQIWWIEADPCYEELNTLKEKTAKEGGVYRISNIARSMSLDQGHSRAPGRAVIGYEHHGAPWQLWRFRRWKAYFGGGETYIITSVHSGNVIDSACFIRQANIDSESQAWELVNPLISIPHGWLQIRNVSSDHLLSHTFISLPPISVLSTSKSLSYPESWATQWAFIRASDLGHSNAGSRDYIIRNRLTRAYLRCQESKFLHQEGKEGSVNAYETRCYAFEFWRFDRNAQSNWKIVDSKSGFLLEEVAVPLMDGMEVVCVTKTTDERRSWALIPIKDIDRTDTSRPRPPVNVTRDYSSRPPVNVTHDYRS